jgi:hypothetical protein
MKSCFRLVFFASGHRGRTHLSGEGEEGHSEKNQNRFLRPHAGGPFAQIRVPFPGKSLGQNDAKIEENVTSPGENSRPGAGRQTWEGPGGGRAGRSLAEPAFHMQGRPALYVPRPALLGQSRPPLCKAGRPSMCLGRHSLGRAGLPYAGPAGSLCA